MSERYYFYHEKSLQIIWFENDMPYEYGWWRTIYHPNSNIKSSYMRYKMVAEKTHGGIYKQITKEEANRICKEWYYKKIKHEQ